MFRSKVVKLATFGFSSVLMSASIISFLILTSNPVSADDSVISDVSISVPVSCSVTGTLDTDHTATVNNGTYQEDIGTTTFKVVCNDNSGYSIYAVGYSNEEFGNTKMLATIGGVLTPASDFNTGLNTSGNTSAWAMKIIPVTTASSGTTQPYTPTIESDTNGSFSNYHIVPSTYTKVATFASSTDFTIGSSIQSTYRVFISSNQLAGNYNGKVRYTLVHPASEVPTQPVACTHNRICYNPNGSNVVGTMGQPYINSSATGTSLLPSNFSRDGYGFAGWSDVFDYDSNPNAHFYGPQEDITFAAGQYTDSNPGLSLYAVWIKSAGSLQDSAKVAELCGTGTGSLTTAPTDGTANLSSISALTDSRDNQTYAIAKLADGKCWMIENLRLENTTSDNSIGNLSQGYGGSFGGLANAESTTFYQTDAANSLYYSGVQSGTASIDVGTNDYPNYRIPRYNNLNTQSRASNPTSNHFADDHTTGGLYSFGNYYNWSAAMASTLYFDNYNSPSIADANGETANTSICPSGWRLPYGKNTGRGASPGGFSYLDIQLGGTGSSQSTTESVKRWENFPNNFLTSGYCVSSGIWSRGWDGNYLTSTVSGIDDVYMLALWYSNPGGVDPGTEISGKGFGLNIRCVADF